MTSFEKNCCVSANQSEAIAAFTQFFLETVENLLQHQETVTVGLSGGSFIKIFATELPKSQARFDVLKQKVNFIFCDERFVQFNSSDSTYGEFTREGFFSRLGIPSSNVYAINAELDTVEACALEYEARITPLLNKENGFDILILGMGPDGHTCSLFPGHPLFLEAANQTRLVLPISDSPKTPPQRVTLTLNFINNSKNLLFFTCGASKADMLKRIIVDKDLSLPCTNVSPKNPQTSVIRWYVDQDAAKMLQ